MGQVAKLKRTWNLAPVSQIVQKITESYCTCRYLSTWWFVVQKIYSKVHLVSCTNTHRDVTDLVNHEMVKNTKTWISWEWNINFLRNEKILNLCFRWHILRSHHFLVEVIFKLVWLETSFQQEFSEKNRTWFNTSVSIRIIWKFDQLKQP